MGARQKRPVSVGWVRGREHPQELSAGVLRISVVPLISTTTPAPACTHARQRLYHRAVGRH